MKLKRLILIIYVILAITLLASCANPVLPVYEKTNEDGMSVIIDGVRYKLLPLLKWSVYSQQIWEAEVIGYA